MLRHFSFLNRIRKKKKAPSNSQKELPLLPDLILAAGKLAFILQTGRHGQKRHGTGEDFWQFRPYNPYEPASLIDWKQSARSPDDMMLWVKEREKQFPRPLYLWVDPSPSMKWHSSQDLPTKYETAMIAALALGQAALHAGESVTTSGRKRFVNGSHFLPKLALDLSQINDDFPNFRLIPPHATVILISDFFWEDFLLEKLTLECQKRPGRTVFFRILDPAECSFPYKGFLKFTSQENEPTLDLSINEDIQKQYQTILHQSSERLSQISHKLAGAFYYLHHNESPLLPSLLALQTMIGDKA